MIDDPQVASCLDTLNQCAHPAGGWGYRPDAVAQVEPTTLALLALSLHRGEYEETINKGLEALATWQGPEGWFPVRGGYERSVWPTALGIITLTAFQRGDSDEVRTGVAWLCTLKSQVMNPTEQMRQDNEIDSTLLGWPWTESTFSWVDPTAWACLALRHAGLGTHPRVEEGLRLLLDRAYDEGGANAGNRRVFGRRTEPVPANTAMILLAFAGLDDHPKLRAARQYLLDVAQTNADLENLCLIRLALDAWKEEPEVAAALPGLEAAIRAEYQHRHNSPVFPPSVVREALTALALSAHQFNPLLPGATSLEGAQDPGTVPARKTPLLEKIKAAFRGLIVQAVGRLRAVPTVSMVHIARATSYEDDLAAIVWEQYAAFRTAVPLEGKRVVLKPNFVEYHRDKVINTHPAVIAAVIELCRKEGAADVVVAEGPGHWRNVEYLVTASGLADVLRRYDVRFIDLNHDEPQQTQNLGGLTRMEHLYLAKTAVEADVLISMPKLKTHHWAGVTLSLKNLFGIMPGICYGWPKNELHWRGIENSIVDIALTRTPELAIVDGIIGMEGDGPLAGEAKPAGVLVMGNDPLAVDATCCRIMGFDPEKVGHLMLGASHRLGNIKESKIKQVGVPIDDVGLSFVPHPRFASIRFAADEPASGSPSEPAQATAATNMP